MTGEKDLIRTLMVPGSGSCLHLTHRQLSQVVAVEDTAYNRSLDQREVPL
jgi:hypothetical protein